MYADSAGQSIDLEDASIKFESQADERDRKKNVRPEVGYLLDSRVACARNAAHAFILRTDLRNSLIVASSTRLWCS